jgi:hypothetical protein
MPVSQIESTRVWEVENVSVQVSVWEDAEGPSVSHPPQG